MKGGSVSNQSLPGEQEQEEFDSAGELSRSIEIRADIEEGRAPCVDMKTCRGK